MEGKWLRVSNRTDSVTCGRYDMSTVANFETDNAAAQAVNCILNISTSLGAALGNLLVLISIWKTPSLHSPSNVLLFSLALSDFVVGLLVQPLFVTFSIAQMKDLPDTFCISAISLSIIGSTLGSVSLLTITAISCDRYLALRLHLRYYEIVTTKRAVALIVGIWLICGTCSISMVWQPTEDIFKVFFPVVVFLSLCITSFAYCKIYGIVRYHQVQIQIQAHAQSWQHSEDQSSPTMVHLGKSAFNVFLVFCVLLLCYLPYLCVAVVVGVKGLSTKHIQTVHELTWSFMLMNSCLNPLVYCWRIAEIRRAVWATLKKVARCNGELAI